MFILSKRDDDFIVKQNVHTEFLARFTSLHTVCHKHIFRPNFRPISNLKFISKLVEKSVAVQLTKHVMTNHLDETFQSANKEFHSTETALLRVQNDILCSLDQNKSVILLLLDLSAAFDTVDYAIQISRLSHRFGGKPLHWPGLSPT